LLVIFNPNTKGEERRGSRITSTIMIEEWRLPESSIVILLVIFNPNTKGEERKNDEEHG